ncbi:MAG: UDP-glucose 4-epimerase GalE, partial [Sphingomonas bacterium]|nr:UDP-glucose 4-epimerase GalE [Sphingomonas bacterium]
MEKKVLVVGGAGYIGAHTCLLLAQRGYVPVIYDNLTNGHAEFARWGPLELGDIRDRARLRSVFNRYEPEAIVHFAALIEVGQSVHAPLAFYDNNLAGTVSLLLAAEEAGLDKVVFSSTCATYGTPEFSPLTEDHPQAPISPYGWSKLLVEHILRDLAGLDRMRSVMLRYFNAAGADPETRIGEWHMPETHAVPLVIETALGRREQFRIFGTDYATRDGTCVRDYVHVMDLADAHVRAVDYLLGGGSSTALNLGTGTGTSVAELIEEVERVAGRPLNIERTDRRPGDPPVLVADNRRASETLGWRPRHDLASIIESAWRWHAG